MSRLGDWFRKQQQQYNYQKLLARGTNELTAANQTAAGTQRVKDNARSGTATPQMDLDIIDAKRNVYQAKTANEARLNACGLTPQEMADKKGTGIGAFFGRLFNGRMRQSSRDLETQATVQAERISANHHLDERAARALQETAEMRHALGMLGATSAIKDVVSAKYPDKTSLLSASMAALTDAKTGPSGRTTLANVHTATKAAFKKSKLDSGMTEAEFNRVYNAFDGSKTARAVEAFIRPNDTPANIQYNNHLMETFYRTETVNGKTRIVDQDAALRIINGKRAELDQVVSSDFNLKQPDTLIDVYADLERVAFGSNNISDTIEYLDDAHKNRFFPNAASKTDYSEKMQFVAAARAQARLTFLSAVGVDSKDPNDPLVQKLYLDREISDLTLRTPYESLTAIAYGTMTPLLGAETLDEFRNTRDIALLVASGVNAGPLNQPQVNPGRAQVDMNALNPNARVAQTVAPQQIGQNQMQQQRRM